MIKVPFFTTQACVSFVLFFVPTMEVIMSLTWFFGISFCIMLSVPFILLGRYHSSPIYVKKVYYTPNRDIQRTNFIFKVAEWFKTKLWFGQRHSHFAKLLWSTVHVPGHRTIDSRIQLSWNYLFNCGYYCDHRIYHLWSSC